MNFATKTQPDVVLLDLDLVGDLSRDFRPLLMLLSSARVLSFTNDSALHAGALREGPCGVVRKEEGADILLQAMARAHQSLFDTNLTKLLGALEKADRPGYDICPGSTSRTAPRKLGASSDVTIDIDDYSLFKSGSVWFDKPSRSLVERY